MTPRASALALAASLLFGCVHDKSSDQRLDEATDFPPPKEAMKPEQLKKLSCQDGAAGLAGVRNEKRPELDRLKEFTQLWQGIKGKADAFEVAVARNPDLLYQEDSQALADAHALCVQQSAEVRAEFDKFMRELVEVPTVQEIKGGTQVTRERLDFDALRDAIESLAPDDKEALLAKLEAAEKKIDASERPVRRRRRK
jgi:hypothetical protein